MNEFDMRQLGIMIQKINEFKIGLISLPNLIHDLESLLNALEEKDDDWKNTFIGYWWDLEQVYSVALDKEKSILNTEEHKIIDDAIEKLENLVLDKLNKELSLPLPEIKDNARELGDDWLMCPLCQEAWESNSKLPMVRCPHCKSKLHNPNFK